MKETNERNGERKNGDGRKRQAKIILSRCPLAKNKSDNLFGIRVEKIRNDWLRTWTFKIDEEKARHEGFDRETLSGTFGATKEYRGCPYCGTANIAQCACGKIFCYKANSETSKNTGRDNYENIMRLKCPWCGQIGDYYTEEKLDLSGGGF